jgi:hypothetical protein
MAIEYAHTLHCDRRGCRHSITIVGTRHAAHARQLARRKHGWHIRGGDWCPDETAHATACATKTSGARR